MLIDLALLVGIHAVALVPLKVLVKRCLDLLVLFSSQRSRLLKSQRSWNA